VLFTTTAGLKITGHMGTILAFHECSPISRKIYYMIDRRSIHCVAG